jgi:hypothetical protein
MSYAQLAEREKGLYEVTNFQYNLPDLRVQRYEDNLKPPKYSDSFLKIFSYTGNQRGKYLAISWEMSTFAPQLRPAA